MSAIGIGSSLVFAIRSALLGPGTSDTLQGVRDLDHSNGGDFAVSILDFGKDSKRFSDFEGTPAGVGDSVALVVDDLLESDERLAGDYTTSAGWTTAGSNTVVDDNGDILFTYVDSTSILGLLTLTAAGGLDSDLTSGDVYVFEAEIENVGSGAVSVYCDRSSSPSTVRNYPPGAGSSIQKFYFVADGSDRIIMGTAAGGAIRMRNISVKRAGASYALQTTAASRPVVTTDALGRTPIETDGGDDRLDLPDGWLGDGTQHVHVFMAMASDSWDSGDFRRLVTGAGDSLSGFGITTASGSSREKLRIATNGADAMYGREMSASEPVVITGSVYSAGFARLRINGVEVGSDATSATLDDPGAGALFNRTTGGRALAATAWATVSVVGSRAMTDAEKRTVEEYLAGLADVTLAPQTRDEALTVLRRPATPATDLNVTENFDYADTAALLNVWDDGSGGAGSVSMSAPAGDVVLVDGTQGGTGSGRAVIQKTFPARVGRLYKIYVDGSGGSFNIDVDDGQFTTSGNIINDANEPFPYENDGAAGRASPFVASGNTIFVKIQSRSNQTLNISSVRLDEIPRTSTVYDMLDETRMTDSEGGTQALDAGVEILLPSVAEGDAAFGVDVVSSLDASDWTAQSGTSDISNNISGNLVVNRVPGNNSNFRNSSAGTQVEAIYFVEGAVESLTVSGNNASVGFKSGDDAERVVIDGTGAFSGYVFHDATLVEPRVHLFSDGDSVTFSSLSIRPVLHYPLQQTTAAAQPTLRYALHDYLAGVVFSGREVTTGTITSATSLQDLSGSGNAPSVNGSLTVSTPTVPGEVVRDDDFSSFSSLAEVLAVSGYSDESSGAGSIGFAGGNITLSGVDGDSNATGKIAFRVDTEAGEQVKFKFQVAAESGGSLSYRIGTSVDSSSLRSGTVGAGTQGTFIVTATSGTTYITFRNTQTVQRALSSLRVQRLPESLSTVYSGFSAGIDSLEHTIDHLDPGTGDWSMTVVCRGDAPTNPIMEYGHYTGSYSGGVIRFRTDGNAGNAYTLIVSDDGFVTTDRVRATGTAAGSNDPFDRATVLRRGSQIELWVNGTLAEAGTISNAVGSLSGGVLCVGGGLSGTSWPGEIGTIQLHTSGYAPTADEIASMHADLDAIYNRTADSYVFASLEFDGGDDVFEVVDPDNDLAITGDVTIVAAVTPDSAAATQVLATAGDPASDNTDVAHAAMLDGAGKQRFDQASATGKESDSNTQSSIVAGTNTTLSWVREGSSMTMAQDVIEVEVDALSVTATAGAAPATLVGTRVTGSGQHFDGTYSGLAIYDGALPTGQVVVLESAMTKLSSGG